MYKLRVFSGMATFDVPIYSAVSSVIKLEPLTFYFHTYTLERHDLWARVLMFTMLTGWIKTAMIADDTDSVFH